MTINQAFLNLKEDELLALCLYGEARNQGIHGLYAVGLVILNRLRLNQWFGNSLKEVILKPYQFSCFNENDPQYEKLLNIAKDFSTSLKESLLLRECFLTAQTLLKCYDATHYFAKHIKPPYWVKDMYRRGEVGDHIFYKEEGK